MMSSELVNVCQAENETMVVHHKRFKNVVNVMKGQWGESHSRKLQRTNWTAVMKQNIRQWKVFGVFVYAWGKWE